MKQALIGFGRACRSLLLRLLSPLAHHSIRAPSSQMISTSLPRPIPIHFSALTLSSVISVRCLTNGTVNYSPITHLSLPRDSLIGQSWKFELIRISRASKKPDGPSKKSCSHLGGSQALWASVCPMLCYTKAIKRRSLNIKAISSSSIPIMSTIRSARMISRKRYSTSPSMLPWMKTISMIPTG